MLYKELEALNKMLECKGLKVTRQRKHILAALLDQRDHPTVDEVYIRVRKNMPTISLATVYNALEALLECGLVRQVNFDRESSRYCLNLTQHAHFQDKKTGRVYDIDIPAHLIDDLKESLPQKYKITDVELLLRGNIES